MSTQAISQPGQFQYIKLPDGSYGKFASDASDDVIKGAIQKDFPDAFTPTPTQQAANRTGYLPNTSMSAGTQTFDQAHPNATPKQPGIMARFASGAGIPTSQAQTTEAVQGFLQPKADPSETDSTTRFLEQAPVLGGDFRARADLSKRADQEGGTGVGVAHRIASWIPLVGPAVTAAQDKYDQGDYAGAAGAGLSALFSMEGAKTALTPKPNVLPEPTLKQTVSDNAQYQSTRRAFTPPQQQKALPAGPIITPPPADTSGSVPYTPPPVAATTRAQRLGLMLPEKASGPIQLGPGEILPSNSPEGVLPAAPHFMVDSEGNPRVQFLTSPATDQVAPTTPNSAQSLFQSIPAKKPSLLAGIREHEFLSNVQDSLNGQPGDEAGQQFLNEWMESHNQQAPGAKRTPGLMNAKTQNVFNQSIEQANAAGQSVLPPDETPQASPGLMAKAKKGKSGPPSPAQATPAAQPMPPQAPALQPQLATADNTEELLRQSLKAKGIDPDAALAPKGPGLMQNASKQATAPADQRVQYPDLREELDKMAPEDKQRAIFISPQTDLPNRRAFDIAQTNSQAPSVSMTDADGLKAFNDKFGHQAGDALLKAKGDALKKAGIEVYHFGGDEFGARNATPEQFENARDFLRNTTIRVTDADGQTRDFAGADFSYGSGGDLATAEQNMYKMKAERKAAGNAPERGQFGNIKEVGKK